MAAAEKKLKPGPSPLILDLRKVRGFAKKGYTRKQIARMLGCSLAFFLRYEFPDDIRELLDQNGKDMITAYKHYGSTRGRKKIPTEPARVIIEKAKLKLEQEKRKA